MRWDTCLLCGNHGFVQSTPAGCSVNQKRFLNVLYHFSEVPNIFYRHVHIDLGQLLNVPENEKKMSNKDMLTKLFIKLFGI